MSDKGGACWRVRICKKDFEHSIGRILAADSTPANISRIFRLVYQLQEKLARLHEPERLPRPVVELLCDGVEVALRANAQVGPLREVLAKEAVRVLARAAPPRRVRVAEVHLHVERRADLFVARELASLVPRQRVQHELWQVGHLPDYGVLHLLGTVPVRQVEQHREARRALHERADGRLVGRAGDQVALPVAGHGPVLDLCRSLADHDHGVPESGLAPVGGRSGAAAGAARPELRLYVALELALRLHVDGLAYGLVANVHGIIIGELAAKPA